MKLRHTILLIAIFAACLLPISAQAKTSVVAVQVNHEKVVPNAGLRIKFVEMVEDSRCPEDTNCVWAGNAKIRIEVRGARNGRRTFELNTGTAPRSIKYAGYEIKLVDLTPHMRSNIRINRNGYVARLEVKRARK